MDLFLNLLFTAALVFWVWRLVWPRERTPQHQDPVPWETAAAANVATPRKPRLTGDGSFSLHVVGSTHYKTDLKALFRKRIEEEMDDEVDEGDTAETEASVTLRLEDDNEHDPKAVAAFIKGRKVGYLPRSIAPLFRSHVASKGLLGNEFTCKGSIEMPLHPDGEFEISLDLPQLKMRT